MTFPEHVALIGCGFTGTSAFYQLVDKYPVKEVTIFEASGIFGPGYPYRADECKDYLLNNTTDTLCLTPDNRRAFYNWMKSRSDLIPDVKPDSNLPRFYYGLFLDDVFKSTLTSAAIKDINVNLIPNEATTIKEVDGKVYINDICADAAILTTGRCPDKDNYEKPPTGSKVLYFPTHVNEASLDIIPIDASVYILGSSLSAYDVINRLFSENSGCEFRHNEDGILEYQAGPNVREAILCSRSGRLKKMKSAIVPDIKREYFTIENLKATKTGDGFSLEEIAALIKKDCALNDGDINWDLIFEPFKDCKSAADVNRVAAEILENDIDAAKKSDSHNILVDFFGDASIDIWDAFAARLLSTAAEKRYRQQFETAALTYEASCPISTAEKLLALHRAGTLKVIKGVRSVAFSNDDDGYIIDHEFGRDTAKVLINTTGSLERDVTSATQPDIIKSMVSGDILKPYSRDGVAMLGADVDMDSFRVSGTKNIYMANMLLWGPGFFTSGAIYMATIVDRLLKSLLNK